MERYITVKPNTASMAGIGHQFTNWMVPYMLAKRYSLKFVHQPFVGEINGKNAPKYSSLSQITVPVKEWNDFLNLGEGELTLKDIASCTRRIQLPYAEGACSWDHSIFSKIFSYPERFVDAPGEVLYLVSERGCGQFIDIDWDFYRNNDLKKKYNNSERIKNFKCYFDKGETNVAIHIRRGAVTKQTPFRRWIDLDYYLHIMSALADVKELKNIVFHIYTSDMSEEEENILLLHSIFGKTHGCTRRIELHIDEDVFSTFYHFTKADIFVSGQGAFSVIANYLTDAIKLATPWTEYVDKRWISYWHNFPSDIEDIVPINTMGIFDSNKLLKALENKNG